MTDTIRWAIEEQVDGRWRALCHFPGAKALTPKDAFAHVRAMIPKPLGQLRAKQYLEGATRPVIWVEGVNVGQEVMA